MQGPERSMGRGNDRASEMASQCFPERPADRENDHWMPLRRHSPRERPCKRASEMSGASGMSGAAGGATAD